MWDLNTILFNNSHEGAGRIRKYALALNGVSIAKKMDNIIEDPDPNKPLPKTFVRVLGCKHSPEAHYYGTAKSKVELLELARTALDSGESAISLHGFIDGEVISGETFPDEIEKIVESDSDFS
jgi:hypothetical protein